MRPVNLLPPDQRPATASGALRGSAYGVLGVLGVLLLMTLLYVASSNTVTSDKEKTAKIEGQIQIAKAKAAAFAPYAKFGDIKATRIKSVTDLASTRFDWERFMRELALVLPKSAWLTQVDADSAGAGSSATTAASGAAGAPAGPTAHIAGCAKGHDGVAEVLVRMRKLYRAEDVKLDSSAEGGKAAASGGEVAKAPSSGGSGGDCSKFTSFDLTVSFSATPPVQPKRGVPVSLGGGE